MTRIPINAGTIRIPDHLFAIELPLPCVGIKPNEKEPASEAVHRMVSFSGQAHGRAVRLEGQNGAERLLVRDAAGAWEERPVPRAQLIAALSFLESDVLRRSRAFVKSAGGSIPALGPAGARVLPAALDGAQRTILNAWESLGGQGPGNERWPWAGVGIVPTAPDGSEIAVALKDGFHPRPYYCRRYALIGGNIDMNEILGDWGGEHACAFVAMLRELFEEVCDLETANELAAAAEWYGPARANCFLYEDDGRATAGMVRTFVARAPDAAAWARWRKSFDSPDGLAEANPRLLTMDELLEAFAAEERAAVARKRHLRTAEDEALREADDEVLGRLSWGRILQRTRRERPELADKALEEAAQDAWKRAREQAEAAGEFPLRGRGDFAFISGHGGPIRHVLTNADLL